MNNKTHNAKQKLKALKAKKQTKAIKEKIEQVEARIKENGRKDNTKRNIQDI